MNTVAPDYPLYTFCFRERFPVIVNWGRGERTRLRPHSYFSFRSSVCSCFLLLSEILELMGNISSCSFFNPVLILSGLGHIQTSVLMQILHQNPVSFCVPFIGMENPWCSSHSELHGTIFTTWI